MYLHVTPVIFNSPDKVIPLLSYSAVVLALMKSIVDKSNLDYLIHSCRSYTPAQRSALAVSSFKYSVSDIKMNESTFTLDNALAYDAHIPGIFGTLAEQVLTATIKNKKFFRGFYEVLQYRFMGEVSMNCLIMIATTAVSIFSRFTSCKGTELATYIQNRDFHYEFCKTNADKRCSDMSKETALVGACKDNIWLQVSCLISFYTPTIIGKY